MSMFLRGGFWNWWRRRLGGGGPASPRMSISGKNFLDENGQPIVLRGFVAGHGEIMQTGDQAEAAAMGANFWREGIRWWGDYTTGFQVDAEDDADPGYVDTVYFARFSAAIDRAKAQGMRTLFFPDSNCGQGVGVGGVCDLGSGTEDFWSAGGANKRARFIAMVRWVVQQKLGKIDIIEPIVEPSSANADQTSLWAFQEELMSAVLAVDPKMLFLIGAYPNYESNSISNAFNPAWAIPSSPFYGKVALTGNFLNNLSTNPVNRVDRVNKAVTARNTWNCPVLIQQFGTQTANDADDMHMEATATLLDTAAGGPIGYSFWEFVSIFSTSYGIYSLSDSGDPNSARVLKPVRKAVLQAHMNGVPYYMTAPVINGSPTQGSLVIYTQGYAAARPVPSYSADVIVDGVNKGSAATYVIQAGDVGLPVVIRETATNSAGTDSSDSAPVIAVSNSTLLSTGRVGGQLSSIIDFSADAFTGDLMKRARNISHAIGSPYQYVEATTLLRIASLTRVSNVTTVVLTQAPETYQDSANLRTGFRLVLSCLEDPTFDVDNVQMTVIDPTHFTYPNVGVDAVYTAVNIYDVAATSIHSVATGASRHPIEDFYSVLSTVSGSATANSDLNGTYTGYFDGGIPTGLSAEGASLSNWTPGGTDNQFTLTIDNVDTAFIALNFTGVPTDDSFRMPRIHRNDHDQTGTVFLRPDAAQFLSRFKFIRFMDVGRTNLNAYVKSWEKRPISAVGLGLSLEDMVAMCNQLGANMWYCVPQWASDNYITQAATYIRDNLNPALWCIFERCNENWNEGTFPHLMWDLTVARKSLSAYFHGAFGENEITSVTKASGVVTVNLNRAPKFANGATAVFKITDGSAGYDTPDAGAVMTVSGNSFSFTGDAGSGTATVNNATIIGDPSHILYSDHLYGFRELAYRTHGWKTYQMSQLILSVFGSLNGRARVVLMGFEENFVPFGIQEDKVFPWLVAQFGPMSAWCYGIGGAPYPVVTGANMAAITTSFDTAMDASDIRSARVTSLCATYGVHHVQYEANISLVALSDQALIDSMHTDAGARPLQRDMIQRPMAQGAELQAVYYTSMQFPGVGGGSNWGIARTLAADGGAIGAATSERLKGIDDALLAPPP